MDERELLKKFHDKQFLKKNEFAEMMSKIVAVIKANKALVVTGVVLAVVLGIGMPTLRWYQAYRVETFNAKLFEAEKSLKKIDLYQGLVKDYSSIPASQYARLLLVDSLVEHRQFDDAAKQLDQGIKKNNRPDIFSTLLVLKRLDLLKNQEKYLEASDYATNHQNNILKTYLPQYKLYQANLMILAGKKDEARALYEKIVAETETTTEDTPETAKTQNAAIVKTAKGQLMLLDLGVL
jgi:predicted negative regulator of RcsB-dependent stress response